MATNMGIMQYQPPRRRRGLGEYDGHEARHLAPMGFLSLSGQNMLYQICAAGRPSSDPWPNRRP